MFLRGAMVALGLFCLCATMFVIGVMVGRGTAPVDFDTRSFQAKLAKLAGNKNHESSQNKPELDFYKELKKPMPTAFSLPENLLEEEIVASHRDAPVTGEEKVVDIPPPTPIKKGLKKMTRRDVSPAHPPLHGEGTNQGNEPEYRDAREKAPEVTTASRSGWKYTIQISSFRQLADAIGRMEALKVKGLEPHRALALVDGKMWHRVRVGKFFDTLSAEKALRKLETQGIYGIIIENH
ncbi:Sporulation related domain-containing protein [Desulfocicer vacuolatum DSM 3385]|uniref:Sporulation related domain-containing protein n=1 Tax=Desulfocicer vacuolatum DSM 3385 TaxID=1121400 RepID=A0A1W2C4T7_9BACT|nr:SPOR domain-containing protein [Desulfocicer vacuolatum]SMC79728.1 Sporulation related domain-containing protein [Desulfocicer vacuolatum DSM 3385]